MKVICYTFLLVFLYQSGQSQEIKLLRNIKPLKKRADRAYRLENYEEAAGLFVRAYEKDTFQVGLAVSAGHSFYQQDLFEQSEKWFRTGLSENPTDEDDILIFSQTLIANGKYDEAREWLNKYKSLSSEEKVAYDKIDAIDHIYQYYEDSSVVNVYPLSLNTEHEEFSPFYYKNGIVFLSNNHKSNISNELNWNDEDYMSIYSSEELESGKMTIPVAIDNDYNLDHHKGPLVIFDDFMIYTTYGFPTKKSKERRHGLYLSQFDNDKKKWVRKQSFPFNNNNYSVGQPAISTDGSTLIFASDMPGGHGGVDLYISRKKGVDWGEPQNLGTQINTSGNEMFPFLISDQLIFASDGHGGLGDLDLYRSTLTPKSSEEIINLGYPFNSPYADFGLISDSLGRTGYFTSNRKKGGTDDDIYRYRIKWAKVDCQVIDKGSNTPLQDVMAQFISGETLLDTKYTDSTGMVDLLAGPEEEITVEVSHEKYLPKSMVIPQDRLFAGKSFVTTITLEKRDDPFAEEEKTIMEKLEDLYNRKKAMIQVNGRVYEYREVGNSSFIVNADENILLSHNALDENLTLEERAKMTVEAKGLNIEEMYTVKDIYFDFGSVELTDEAKEELNKVIKIMTVDKKIAFSINSYADSRGGMAQNDELAFRRSQMISRYLIAHDIEGSRLILDSYGEQGLLNDCDDNTGCEELFHAVNRRAEFELLMRKIYK